MKTLRILIVDDDALARRVLGDALAPLGCVVEEAKDGEEGIARYRQARPDVVLLDLMMPNASGLQTLEALRREDPTCRVVVVTSLEADSLRASTRQAGAVGYVVKPFHPIEIRDAVERVLNTRA